MLKKILFTFLFFFSILNLFSQDYEPVLKEGSFWDMKTIEDSSDTCFNFKSLKRIQVDGDTIINTKTYKKLKSTLLVDKNNSNDCISAPFYLDENSFTPIKNTFLREDVNEKKLYILTNTISNNVLEEFTICDFSLNIGDAVDNYFGFDNTNSGLELKITDITVNSENKKVYHTSDGSTYTEGIGKNEGNLNIYFTTLDGIQFLIHCNGNSENKNNCATIIGRNYKPVIKEGSFWDVVETGPGFCSFRRRYQIDGDTIFNNIIYKKLKSAPIRSFDTSDLCITWGDTFIRKDDFSPILTHFIREDIVEKKLYIHLQEDSDIFNEYLLADYNLNVGDTLTNAYAVDMKISQISILPDGRKKYYLDNHHSYEEGIGRSQGPIAPYHWALSESSLEIGCYGNTANQNNCTKVLNTKKHNLSSIKTYPNPVKNILTIDNKEDVTLKIFSLTGKLLKKIQSASNLKIDISSFKTGIYILELSNSKGKKRSKILKL